MVGNERAKFVRRVPLGDNAHCFEFCRRLGQLERGERVARADTIAKLAGALKADPGEFFEGIVWETGAVSVGRFELPDQDATL